MVVTRTCPHWSLSLRCPLRNGKHVLFQLMPRRNDQTHPDVTDNRKGRGGSSQTA